MNAKRFTLLIVFLACAIASLAALPSAFTSKGNPGLYKTLRSKALGNLAKLDRH